MMAGRPQFITLPLVTTSLFTHADSFVALEDSSLGVRLLLHRDGSGRPSSTYVWSPHDIGRESWVWEEQGALWIGDSPHKVGEEALAE